MGLDELVFRPGGSVRPEQGCSDLYSLYIEWLDLASREALFNRDAARLAVLRGKAARLRRDVPAVGIAPHHGRALQAIEARGLPAEQRGTS
jgi:hypothetical protein